MTVRDGEFAQQCYDLLKHVPQGKVTTYKELARALNTKAWRAVGTAMARNSKLVVVPCHRVVKSNGEIGQYALGTAEKAALLSKEGVAVANGKVKNLEQYFHRFN